MIKSIRHIGIKVKDMDESLRFWKAQGFEVVYDEYEVWKQQRLHIIKLKCEHGTTLIELVDGNWRNHIAVTVDKLPFPKLATKRPSGHKVFFAVSPEGVRIELVEEPKP